MEMAVDKTELKHRLVLGTAQFGMAYGIANHSGQPDQMLANDILVVAWENGIRILDTAQAYGESEVVLGKFFECHPECQFEVITKLAPDVDITSVDEISSAVIGSNKNLGQKPLALLLHNYKQLHFWDGILGDTLRAMMELGEIRHLGVSLYHPDVNPFLQVYLCFL